ncbi:MAG: hypothetical protein NZT92_12390 [Abditibacteriales bacterium]|nr:hypothetical protein [Abditibacteriales bacterium]
MPVTARGAHPSPLLVMAREAKPSPAEEITAAQGMASLHSP